jgi:hypothetical protein
MDETLTAPAGQQSAAAQPGGKQEWTVPILRKLDLTETREPNGSDRDLILLRGS